MTREQILSAYFSNPPMTKIIDTDKSAGIYDLCLDSVDGVLKQCIGPCSRHFLKQPFTFTPLMSLDPYVNKESLLSYFNNELETGGFYDYYNECGLATPPGWRLTSFEIQANSGCYDGGAFIHAYWICEDPALYAVDIEIDENETIVERSLMFQPDDFTILIEQGENLAYILEYISNDHQSCIITLTEIMQNPGAPSQYAKTRIFRRWFIDEHDLPWEVYFNTTFDRTT